MNIDKQLGLGYLIKKSRRGSSSSGDDDTIREVMDNASQEALITWGRPIIEDMVAKRGPVRLFDVVETRRIPITVAIQVINTFEKQGIVDVTDRDLKGNYEVRLTDKGRSLIAV